MLLVDLLDLAMIKGLEVTIAQLKASNIHFWQHKFGTGTVISVHQTGVIPSFTDISLYFDATGKFISTVNPN